jgi:hypothetical protein
MSSKLRRTFHAISILPNSLIRVPTNVPTRETMDYLGFLRSSRSNITMATGLRKVLIFTNSQQLALYSVILYAAENWTNLRGLSLLDKHWDTVDGLDHEARILRFLNQWMNMRDHTKNWEYFAPNVPNLPQLPHAPLKWGLRISQWMASIDRHYRYTVRLE